MNQVNPETKIELNACRLIYENLGIEGGKLKIIGNNGYPDRIFWLPGGKPLLIEFKQPGEIPEPKQQEIHDLLKGLGYNVQVHTSDVDALQAVIEALETTRLPKESRKILAGARRRCAALRSRTR